MSAAPKCELCGQPMEILELGPIVDTWYCNCPERTSWPNLETLVWLVAGMGITIALVCA